MSAAEITLRDATQHDVVGVPATEEFPAAQRVSSESEQSEPPLFNQQLAKRLYDAAGDGNIPAIQSIMQQIPSYQHNDYILNNFHGWNSLTRAIDQNQIAVVREFVNTYNVDITRKEEGISGVLVRAAYLSGLSEFDNSEQMQAFLDETLTTFNQELEGKDSANMRQLLRDSGNDGAEIVSILINSKSVQDKKEFVNHKDEIIGKTPLFQAVTANRIDAARVLIQAGADPRWSDDLTTTLHIAANYGNAGLIDTLTSAPVFAAMEEPLPAVAAFVNQKGKGGKSALFIAAKNNDVAAVQALMRAGANVMQGNSIMFANLRHKEGEDDEVSLMRGYTPFHEACKHGNFDVAKEMMSGYAFLI